MRHFPANDSPIEPGGSVSYDLDVGETMPVHCRMPVRLRVSLPDGTKVEVELPPMTPIRFSRPDEEAEAKIDIDLMPMPDRPKVIT